MIDQAERIGGLKAQGPGELDLTRDSLLPENRGECLGFAELAPRQLQIDR